MTILERIKSWYIAVRKKLIKIYLAFHAAADSDADVIIMLAKHNRPLMLLPKSERPERVGRTQRVLPDPETKPGDYSYTVKTTSSPKQLPRFK